MNNVEYRIAQENQEEFDVVLEAVGTPIAIEQSIMFTRAGGTLILMGNPSSDIDIKQDVYWRILRKQLTLIGTWNSSYKNNGKCDWEDVKEALENKEIKALSLISHSFTSDELSNGLELMRKHNEPFCKVMTIWNNND